jgi:hypothetical protein
MMTEEFGIPNTQVTDFNKQGEHSSGNDGFIKIRHPYGRCKPLSVTSAALKIYVGMRIISFQARSLLTVGTLAEINR